MCFSGNVSKLFQMNPVKCWSQLSAPASQQEAPGFESWTGSGAFLCGFCMLSSCLRRFPPPPNTVAAAQCNAAHLLHHYLLLPIPMSCAKIKGFLKFTQKNLSHQSTSMDQYWAVTMNKSTLGTWTCKHWLTIRWMLPWKSTQNVTGLHLGI